jgi:hypothetical protein
VRASRNEDVVLGQSAATRGLGYSRVLIQQQGSQRGLSEALGHHFERSVNAADRRSLDCCWRHPRVECLQNPSLLQGKKRH